jgi:glycosyltransferase involved in cell wall biosynthesis
VNLGPTPTPGARSSSRREFVRLRLARLVRFGPRKRIGLAADVAVLAAVGTATQNWFAATLTATALLVLLVLATLGVELMRWPTELRRATGQPRSGPFLGPTSAQTERPALATVLAGHDAALELEIVRSQLAAVKLEANDERTWRDIRAVISRPGTRRRTRLFVFPMNGVNAYLELIYQELPRWDFDVVPVGRVADLDAAGSGDVVHYHWTKHVQSGCSTIAEARAASDALLEQLRSRQQRGATIIWGVHEALPHECRFPDVEIEFRRSLVDLADLVQVLHPLTNAALAGAFTIPDDKMLVVPHPLYTGAQADHVTRAAARADLGYGSDDLVLLGLGAIRPYKGYERVVRMMPSLQRQLDGRRLTFVIAGPVQRDPAVVGYAAELEAEIQLLPDPSAVRLIARTVPENHLHRLLRSADVSVAPYRDGLNSGVLLLNMSFGVPTVIASNVVTEDIARFGPVTTFAADDDGALHRALLHTLSAPSVRPVDPDFAEANSPAVVSAAFAETLRAHLCRREAELRSPLSALSDRSA